MLKDSPGVKGNIPAQHLLTKRKNMDQTERFRLIHTSHFYHHYP